MERTSSRLSELYRYQEKDETPIVAESIGSDAPENGLTASNGSELTGFRVLPASPEILAVS